MEVRMIDRLTIAQRGLLVVLMIASLELGFVLFLTGQLRALTIRLDEERQSRRIAELINRFARSAHLAGSDMVKALMVPRKVREELGLDGYKRQINSALKDLGKLRSHLGRDPDGLLMVDVLEKATGDVTGTFEYLNKLEPTELTPDLIGSFIEMPMTLTSQCDRFMAKYALTERGGAGRTDQTMRQIGIFLAVGVVLAFLGNMIAAALFFKKLAGRLFAISENASRFACGEPLRARLAGSDEIAAIDGAFHDLVSDLAEAREMERILVEYSPDVLASMDTKGTFIEVSQAAEKQWGWEPGELVGLQAEKTLCFSGLSSLIETLVSESGREAICTFEERITKKNGTAVDTLWTARWSEHDGSLFASIRDVSETRRLEEMVKEKEEELRLLIASMPVGIVTVDEQGRIKSINRMGCHILQRDREDIQARLLTDYLKPLPETVPVEPVLIHEQGVSAPRRFSVPSERGAPPDDTGSARFMDVFSTRLWKKRDEFLVLLHDVSERQRLDQAKKDFVSLLGHNLRKPLMTVKEILADLLVKGSFEERNQARLRRMGSTLMRLISLIDQLINIEVLGSGRLLGSIRPCPLDHIIREAIDGIADYAEQQTIRIERGQTEASVAVDGQRMAQVLINLMSNAIKYSPSGTTVYARAPQ